MVVRLARYALLLALAAPAGCSTPDAGSTSTTSAAATAAPSPPAPSPPAPTASAFSCTPAGVAAFADQLVNAGRTSCTSEGTGVVRDDNYACIQPPIDRLAPPHPDAAYHVIDTLLHGNTQWPNLECTYFVQAVTAAVCGTPISPPDTPWTDYPLAYMFARQRIQGYSWIANDGSTPVEAGDIFVYDSSDGGARDPGHIMIVAQVIDHDHFRIAEANELNSDGSRAPFGETGVVSNTRVTALADHENLAGWFRLSSN
jgi:CHAP domain